jgi:CheY-like chemotaxis protein
MGSNVHPIDVSMPVMSGYESTRLIRSIEAERRIAYEHQQRIQSPWLCPPESSFPFHTQPSSNATSPSSYPSIDLHLSTPNLKLNKPALIIALTGFSSEKDQEMAFESGVDVFMTKPVRFREVGKILEGWTKSRELESFRVEVVTQKDGRVSSKTA